MGLTPPNDPNKVGTSFPVNPTHTDAKRNIDPSNLGMKSETGKTDEIVLFKIQPSELKPEPIKSLVSTVVGLLGRINDHFIKEGKASPETGKEALASALGELETKSGVRFSNNA